MFAEQVDQTPRVPPRAVQKPMGQELQMPTEPPLVVQTLWVPLLVDRMYSSLQTLWVPPPVDQMPMEPQVPVRKVMTLVVVQKVPGPGFQLQNINSFSIVVNHFMVINIIYVRCTHQNYTITISKQFHLHGVAGAPNGVAGACPNMSY